MVTFSLFVIAKLFSFYLNIRFQGSKKGKARGFCSFHSQTLTPSLQDFFLSLFLQMTAYINNEFTLYLQIIF